jgi:hypothetical protein
MAVNQQARRNWLPWGHLNSNHDSHHGAYCEKKSIWKELFD